MSLIPPNHSSKLDVLRILLCVLVLMCHFYPGCHALAGQLAVIGFFVLSGYLLQSSFYRTKSFDVERFYEGKARRLLPLLLVSLIPSIGVIIIRLLMGKEISTLPLDQDAFSIFRYAWHYNIVIWFMSCLIVFLLMAPLFWWLHRMRWGIQMLFVGAFIFAAFLYWRHDGTSAVLMGLEGSMTPHPQVRLWEFLAGMLMCRWVHSSENTLSPSLRQFFAACVIVALIVLSAWISYYFRRGYDLPNTFLFNVASVVMFSLLTALWDDSRTFVSSRLTRIFMWGASLIYGVYLLHLPVRGTIRIILSKLFGEGVFINIAAMVGSVVGAIALTELVNYIMSLYRCRKKA